MKGGLTSLQEVVPVGLGVKRLVSWVYVLQSNALRKCTLQ